MRWGVFVIAGLGLSASLAFAAGPATKKPSEADRGRELYNRHCVQCHGPAARGDGLASASLVNPPKDVQGKVEANATTIPIVLRGLGPMPAFDQSFGEEDARKVLKFMAALTDQAPARPAEPAPSPAPAAPAPAEGGEVDGGEVEGGG